MSGPNSPTAPIAPMACPNGVRSSPASRMIGRIVPSAVEHSAMPTTIATSPGAMIHVMPTPTARLMSHPTTANRPVRPRKAANSISDPATKNSMARPNSDSAAMKSDGTAQPSRDGPTRMPRTSSKTTIGIRTHLLRLRANSGASTASSGMIRRVGSSSSTRSPYRVGGSPGISPDARLRAPRDRATSSSPGSPGQSTPRLRRRSRSDGQGQ